MNRLPEERDEAQPGAEVARSDRIVLRTLAESDAEEIASACADPDIARFIPFVPSPYTINDALEFITSSQGAFDRGDEAPLAVSDAESGEFLGVVTVPLVDDGGVGYWIKP